MRRRGKRRGPRLLHSSVHHGSNRETVAPFPERIARGSGRDTTTTTRYKRARHIAGSHSYIAPLGGPEFPNHLCRSGSAHEIRKPLGLCGKNASAEIRQPIITPARVVHFRVRPFIGFFDQPVFQQPADCTVQSARPQLHTSSASPRDFLHDRVPVSLAVGECKQDMKHGRRQRQETAGRGFCRFSCSHCVSSIDITYNDIDTPLLSALSRFLKSIRNDHGCDGMRKKLISPSPSRTPKVATTLFNSFMNFRNSAAE